jgi:dolichol-phosphate mannosyltransferase
MSSDLLVRGPRLHAFESERVTTHLRPALAILGMPPARLLKFLIVGASGVLVNDALLVALYDGAHLPLIAASILATEVSTLNGYIWNDRWTFGRRDFSLIRLAQFHLVSLGGLGIATTTLWTLATLAGLHYLLANLAGTALATLWNLEANRLWTWRAQPPHFRNRP